MPRSLWWIKKDVRLHDNPALTSALASGADVLPVFLFEPAVLDAPETSAFHVAAWCEALADLQARVPVLVLHGDATDAFARLRDVAPFEAIHSHEEIGTENTFARDRAVGAWCRAEGVVWTEHRQTGVFRGDADRDTRDARWRAFTDAGPLPVPPDLTRVRVPTETLSLAPSGPVTAEAFGHPLTAEQAEHRQPVSESAAIGTLASFLGHRGIGYSGGISSPNRAFASGSRLSVHLAWGTTTGRAVYAATQARIDELKTVAHPDAAAWRKSLAAFKSRLHWRDHFVQRLETKPGMEFESLNAAYADLPTPGDVFLDDWLAGRTGWPLVDACMRCAAATGFLNFRMRALVTSVAVHSLRMSWSTILHPMARLWADYEPGIHIAQTQMQAGVVGINQLRVYSPDKQLADQDPDAVFVRRWVPELADATPAAIFAHPETPLPGYPLPLVDWRESSKAMRDDFTAIRERPETRALADAVYLRHGSRRARSERTWKSNGPKSPSEKAPKVPAPLPLFPDA